jgi:hypothetical protein
MEALLLDSRRLQDDDKDREYTMNSNGDSRRQSDPNGVSPPFSEDDLQREQLGPRGVPGQPNPTRMPPQSEQERPKESDFDGHTA